MRLLLAVLLFVSSAAAHAQGRYVRVDVPVKNAEAAHLQSRLVALDIARKYVPGDTAESLLKSDTVAVETLSGVLRLRGGEEAVARVKTALSALDVRPQTLHFHVRLFRRPFDRPDAPALAIAETTLATENNRPALTKFAHGMSVQTVALLPHLNRDGTVTVRLALEQNRESVMQGPGGDFSVAARRRVFGGVEGTRRVALGKPVRFEGTLEEEAGGERLLYFVEVTPTLGGK